MITSPCEPARNVVAMVASTGVWIIKKMGGMVIAQDRPSSFDFSMPDSSIQTGKVDFILPLDGIAPKLVQLIAANRT